MTYVKLQDDSGKTMRVALVRTAKGVWVGWPGASTFVKQAGRAVGESLNDDAVRAPMTGRVVKINVAVNDAVKADDVLLILEAMKMEYRLTAPHDGVVESIGCAEGALVELGDVLIQLAKE